MLVVIFSLLPGIAVQTYYFGTGVIINLLLCSTFCLASEAFILILRRRPLWPTLRDNSALLTGLLLGLALPPLLPWWMVFIGSSFAIIFAKQVYGGLGSNPFNPAMIGFVLLLISFPLEMTSWLPIGEQSNLPSVTQSIQLVLFSTLDNGLTLQDFMSITDGITMATPLDETKTALTQGLTLSEIQATQDFSFNLNAWFWINFSFMLGGLSLLVLKIIKWRIPLSIAAGVFIMAFIMTLNDSDTSLPAFTHLFVGATMLSAFFIATDPVTSPTTKRGQLWFGFLIGVLVMIIRAFGGYPDAFAFAILLLNIAVPTIEHYTQPKVYGVEYDKHSDTLKEKPED